MAPVIGLVIGIITGIFTAKRKGGNKLDMAQYGAGFGIAFTLLGLLVAIVLARLGA